MKHAFEVRVGPAAFRIGSDWRAPIAQLEALYAGYPQPEGAVHYTVRLFAARRWRRFVRPSVEIGGDHMLPGAVPLPLRLGLLGAEMAMNLQLALGERRFLLLHAATVERDGKALILTGESGSGKSTLATLLATRGWRFMGDEFALIAPETGLAHSFPRPSSLKNAGIDAIVPLVDAARLGPLLRDTPKGDIRHVAPAASAIAAMDTPSRPVAVVFPRFGHDAAARPVAPSEAFVRLTQASTKLCRARRTWLRCVDGAGHRHARHRARFPDGGTGCRLIDDVWSAL